MAEQVAQVLLSAAAKAREEEVMATKNHWWPFKVGDRVRIKRCKVVDLIGKTGTIVEANIYDDLYVGYIVEIDGRRWSFGDFKNRKLSVEFIEEEEQVGGDEKIMMEVQADEG